MRLPWISEPAQTPGRDIRCSNREAAEAEARRQQDCEEDSDTEWIFLRDQDRNWVARRTPRLPARPFRESLFDAMLDVFLP
jgi:hypothetical protein